MNRKVLIVDDDEVVVFLHDLIIKRSGFADETLIFKDGLQALQYLDGQTDPLQQYILFLDINMPVMNGWQLLSALEKTAYKDRLTVIVVSSSIDHSDLAKSRIFPTVHKYIQKPLTVLACEGLKSSLALSVLAFVLEKGKLML